MKIFRKRKGLRIRIAALLMAFLICFSSFAVCEMKAEAAAVGAAVITVVGSMIAAGSTATASASLACTVAVAVMLLEFWNYDVWLSEKAAAQGMSKSDYLIQQITGFFESTGRTIEQGCTWLLDGCVWLYDGTVQLQAVATEKWKDLFSYIFLGDNVFSSVDNIPSEYMMCGDYTFYRNSLSIVSSDRVEVMDLEDNTYYL